MNSLIARIALLWSREPVVITGLIDAVLVLAVHLGLPLDDGTKVAIDGVLAAIGVLIARSQVSPA